MSYRVYLDWRPERAAYILVISKHNQDGTTEHVKLVPEKISRYGTIKEDDQNWFDNHEAQELMLAFTAEARKHGIRPPLEAADTEAMRKHLEDMRALIFAKLSVEKP